MMIEHGGFENWAKLHDVVDENVEADPASPEATGRRLYRERLHEWAAAARMLTLDDAMATMRRRNKDRDNASG